MISDFESGGDPTLLIREHRHFRLAGSTPPRKRSAGSPGPRGSGRAASLPGRSLERYSGPSSPRPRAQTFVRDCMATLRSIDRSRRRGAADHRVGDVLRCAVRAPDVGRARDGAIASDASATATIRRRARWSAAAVRQHWRERGVPPLPTTDQGTSLPGRAIAAHFVPPISVADPSAERRPNAVHERDIVTISLQIGHERRNAADSWYSVQRRRSPN